MKIRQMIFVSTKLIINAPASRVWETLHKFDGVERYLPVVKSSAVRRSDDGAERLCIVKMSHDQEPMILEEKLLDVDEINRSLHYIIVNSSMPIDDYMGTMKVIELDESTCEVKWSSTFSAKGIPENELVGMIKRIYVTGLDGLRKLHEW